MLFVIIVCLNTTGICKLILQRSMIETSAQQTFCKLQLILQVNNHPTTLFRQSFYSKILKISLQFEMNNRKFTPADHSPLMRYWLKVILLFKFRVFSAQPVRLTHIIENLILGFIIFTYQFQFFRMIFAAQRRVQFCGKLFNL